MKNILKIITICFILGDFSAVEAQSIQCQPTIEYQIKLTNQLNNLEKAAPYLKQLSQGERIETSVVTGFLFSVDLNDENAVQEKLLYLKTELNSKIIQSLRAKEVDESCLKNRRSLGTLERKIKSQLKLNKQYKIAYFSIPTLERQQLIPRVKPKGDFESKSGEVTEQLEVRELEKKKIEKAMGIAEKRVEDASSKEEMALAKSIVDLETYRAKIASLSVSSLAELKIILDKYDAISRKLKELQITISSTPHFTDEQLLIIFSKAKTQWRTLIYRSCLGFPGLG